MRSHSYKKKIPTEVRVKALQLHYKKRSYSSYRQILTNKVQFEAILHQIDLLGVSKVSKNLKIPKSTLRRWRRKSPLHFGKLRAPGGGQKPFFSKPIEEKLYNSLISMVDSHLPISHEIVRQEALKIAPNDSNFKASSGWIKKILNRWNLSFRTPTLRSFSSSTITHNNITNSISTFWKSIYEIRKKFRIPLQLICNMDEVPIVFDSPPRKILARKGQKFVVSTTTGSIKKRVTVVLSCCADGTKLPPMVIFKGKSKRSLNGIIPPFISKIVITHQENAWSTLQLTDLWVETVWKPFENENKSLLIWDEFEGHQQQLLPKNTNLVVVPPNCTPILQPLDVCINKPFKDKIRSLWTNHITQKYKNNETKTISKKQLLDWICISWNNIDESIIKNAFLTTGISNSIDGLQEKLCHVNPALIVPKL